MSVLLVGLSHRTAPVSVLEKVAITDTDRPKLTDRLLDSSHISEAMVVSTCNRIEIYAVVDAFHPALTEVAEALAQHAGISVADLTAHSYVRYSEAAAEHLFSVASGLDSMVVGEQQILGQIRSAYAASDSQQAAGRTLHELAQQALRVGKRVHTETGIDGAGASVVSVALDRAGTVLGGSSGAALAGRKAVVLGAGAMGSLAVAQLGKDGVREVVVVNRTRDRADRLAERARETGVNAVSAPLDELVAATVGADVLVTCTGAVGSVVTLAEGHRIMAARDDAPLVICDLGMPRDVDPAVAGLPGVTVIDMERLQHEAQAAGIGDDAGAAREIVTEELGSYLAGQRAAQVTPTVTALRRRAAEVVEAELMRLDSKLPALGDGERDEVARTVRRVVDKLLHAPTVRVKQLASAPGGDSYAAALRELFELEPGTIAAVSKPDVPVDQGQGIDQGADGTAAGPEASGS